MNDQINIKEEKLFEKGKKPWGLMFFVFGIFILFSTAVTFYFVAFSTGTDELPESELEKISGPVHTQGH